MSSLIFSEKYRKKEIKMLSAAVVIHDNTILQENISTPFAFII